MRRFFKAVIREVEEETGVKMEIDRLGFIHENFFRGDSGKTEGKPVYEISFFFYMKTPENFDPICDSYAGNGSKEFLTWATVDDERKYFPRFFRTELASPSSVPKHIVEDDYGFIQ